ncbi:EGF-like repeat and discoidin I-like domain-containing protein 3 isoform X1 [Oscarella lobularis]|uniref:EGF-like repeat and discoidin I-like domain-containing protein 3 isoform X1 n=1 Tax=Oscarella lobularis TaxID=121494 RepID=UPI0033135EEB
MYSNDKRVWKYYRENNEDKEFSANAEQFSVVRNNFAQAVSTQYIRIKPVSWHGHICMRAEFFGCHKACESPLGMTTGAISTFGLESSSNYNDGHHQKFSRLNSINLGPNSLAWCAAQNDQNQFLQIDIGYVTTVTAVATQGRSKDINNCCDQWVTSYSVQYSKDGYLWNYYEVHGSIKTFSGNSDNDGVVRNYFSDGAVSARYIRIRPRTVHGHTSMRAEVYGCPKKCDLPLGMTTGAIANHQVRSSSDYDHAHSTKFARLTTTTLVGASAWCAKRLDTNQWLQINLGKVRRVTAVATQGRSDADQWITTYYIEYSTIGDDWNTYEDKSGNAKVYSLIWGTPFLNYVCLSAALHWQFRSRIRCEERSWTGRNRCSVHSISTEKLVRAHLHARRAVWLL